MNWLLLRLIWVCFGITVITSGVLVNLLQCILYFTLFRINKTLYRKINYFLCYTIYSQFVFISEWWANIDLILYSNKEEFDKYFGKEHGFAIFNHSYEIDWFAGWILGDRIQILGNAKAYAKKSIQYLPVIGWAWKFAEFVFLERSFEKDKIVIERQIKELSDYPYPMWLLLLPEGTRFTEKKHEASLKFAREHGLPELKYHLNPRTKGFTFSLPGLREKVPALYDIVLSFEPDSQVEPLVTSLLQGKSLKAHMYLKRYPLSEVPHDEEKAAQFLKDAFVRKDKLRESFANTGDFFTTSGIERVDKFRLKRRYYSLINFLCWSVVTVIPIVHYLFKMIISGNIIYITLGTCILGLFIFVARKMIGTSQISKGSSYGTDNNAKLHKQ